MQPCVRNDFWLIRLLNEFHFKTMYAYKGQVFYEAESAFEQLGVAYRVAHVLKHHSDKKYILRYDMKTYLTAEGIVLFALRVNVTPLAERILAGLWAPPLPPPLLPPLAPVLPFWGTMALPPPVPTPQQPVEPAWVWNNEQSFPWTSDPPTQAVMAAYQ